MKNLPDSGHTEVSATGARALALTALVLLAAVPLVQHAAVQGAGPFGPFYAGLGELFQETGGERRLQRVNVRLQALMDELEERLEDESWILERMLPPVQWLLTGWGGAGNEEVYVGHRGWLFYRPGFDYLTGPPFLDRRVLERRRRAGPSWREPPEPDPRPAVLDFHRQLRDLGIPLIVMPVPTKASIHPERFAPDFGGRTAVLQNPSFSELRSALEDDGIVVFDPTTALASRDATAFLRTDSHWSPDGVDTVARELAARVRRLEPAFAAPEVRWQRGETRHAGVGDLARTLRLPAWRPLYGPETVRLERVAEPDGSPFRNDPGAEVLLLGDSFANVFSDPGLGWGQAAGLAEQLAFHLRRGVHRVAVNNAGATGSRLRLLREIEDGRTRLEDKEVVIWQFAVRELVTGDWRTVSLPATDVPQ